MKRLQTPPVIEATMLTTAVKPCSPNEEVMYGLRLDCTAENSDSTNWARYRLSPKRVSNWLGLWLACWIGLRDKDEDERLFVPYGSDGLGAANTILLDLAIGIEFRRHSVSIRYYRCVFGTVMRLLTGTPSRTAFDIVQSVAHD